MAADSAPESSDPRDPTHTVCLLAGILSFCVWLFASHAVSNAVRSAHRLAVKFLAS